MKHVILLVLLLTHLTSVSLGQEIEIKASRLHGLIIFTYSNSGRKNYSPYIQEYTDKSKFKSEVRKIIGDFSKIDESLARGAGYREEGLGYGDEFTVREILEIQSAYASDVEDLMLRMQRLLPIEDWRELRRILKALDPIYEKLIWTPYKNDILAAEKIYREKVASWKVNELFGQAEEFYNAEWPADLKMTVALYPIPKGARHSNAHSLSGFESVGIISGETDIAGRFGVMFHEMMHSLYEAQKFEFKQKLLGWFDLNNFDTDRPYRKGAQQYSNEIYATAVGNGWFYEKVTGAQDTYEWYNDEYVNTLAHAMYETTKDYLKKGRSIDKEYVKKLTAAFKSNFPKYHLDPEYLLQSVEISHTARHFNSADIKKAVKKNFQTVSMGISGSSNLLNRKFQFSQDEETTMTLLSLREARELKDEELANLDLPAPLKNILKEAANGIWVWTAPNGKLRMLGISQPERLEDLFKMPVQEIVSAEPEN
jgi:hypothetical protein